MSQVQLATPAAAGRSAAQVGAESPLASGLRPSAPSSTPAAVSVQPAPSTSPHRSTDPSTIGRAVEISDAHVAAGQVEMAVQTLLKVAEDPGAATSFQYQTRLAAALEGLAEISPQQPTFKLIASEAGARIDCRAWPEAGAWLGAIKCYRHAMQIWSTPQVQSSLRRHHHTDESRAAIKEAVESRVVKAGLELRKLAADIMAVSIGLPAIGRPDLQEDMARACRVINSEAEAAGEMPMLLWIAWQDKFLRPLQEPMLSS